MLRPNFVLLFTIKPVIYGSIASRILNIKSISMITGLGTAFLQKKWLSDLVKRLYKIALKNHTEFFSKMSMIKTYLKELNLLIQIFQDLFLDRELI